VFEQPKTLDALDRAATLIGFKKIRDEIKSGVKNLKEIVSELGHSFWRGIEEYC
jgi:hypothetical protein